MKLFIVLALTIQSYISGGLACTLAERYFKETYISRKPDTSWVSCKYVKVKKSFYLAQVRFHHTNFKKMTWIVSALALKLANLDMKVKERTSAVVIIVHSPLTLSFLTFRYDIHQLRKCMSEYKLSMMSIGCAITEALDMESIQKQLRGQ